MDDADEMEMIHVRKIMRRMDEDIRGIRDDIIIGWRICCCFHRGLVNEGGNERLVGEVIWCDGTGVESWLRAKQSSSAHRCFDMLSIFCIFVSDQG